MWSLVPDILFFSAERSTCDVYLSWARARGGRQPADGRHCLGRARTLNGLRLLIASNRETRVESGFGAFVYPVGSVHSDVLNPRTPEWQWVGGFVLSQQ